ALSSVRHDIAERWLPQVQRMLGDPDAGVRAAALVAIGAIHHEDSATLSRPLLTDPDPRIRVTAAVALASSDVPADVDAAEQTLVELAADGRDSARAARRDVAAAIRHIGDPRFHPLLIPLLYDASPEVAEEAMESVRAAGASDFLFLPTLVSLLRSRHLKGHVRDVLVSYGQPSVDALAHFMGDPDEDIWVRRHIPGTLARIPVQTSVDALVSALADRDGFLRYKAIAALERLRRTDAPLAFPREPVEAFALREGLRYFNYLSLHDNLVGRKQLAADALLARTLGEKIDRTQDRVYRLLALIYPWKDIGAAQWTLQHGDHRSRASASEYLDNILTGQLRKRIMPVLEDLPVEEKVRRGNVMLKTRPRDVEETLLQLINDDDQVVAAVAIDAVRQAQMWNLGDDIEHVLAYRDAADWYVFEAASWALAERRMPAERRRELWLEPLPAAEIAARLHALPLFASVSVDELFRVSSASRQVRHAPGAILLQEGVVPETIHLLLDGRVVSAGRDEAPLPIEAPAALGFIQALQGAPMRTSIRAADNAVTLALSADELRALLADNTDLVRGLFATLAERVDHSVTSNLQSTGAAPELQALAEDGVGAVEKLLVLQRVPTFARIAVEDMRALAGITHTMTMKVGSTLFQASAPVALWLLVSGEISIRDGAGAEAAMAGPGDIIGALSMLSGRPLGQSAEVLRNGITLRIDREDLFDLLAVRPELLRQLFDGMFRSLPIERAAA
ncbi:MAG: HEAT repeat domain-containing protein, partial [Acidobacteriota bacterium]